MSNENSTKRGFTPKQMGGAFERTKESEMFKLGSAKRPALLTVPTEKRKEEAEKICADNGWHCVVTVDQEQDEDVTELESLQNPVKTVRVDKGKSVGRNDSCPCGNGKKYKKCCGK